MRVSRIGVVRIAVVAMLSLEGPLYGAKGAAEKEFTERLKGYQSVRKKAAKGLPRLPDEASPEQIKERAGELQARIQALRLDAKPGDVLTPAVFELISAIRAETAGSPNRTARQTVLGEGNPTEEGAKVPLRINAPYPPEAPLSTVPPEMLARMPELPEGLQYRFVGKHLILYDVEADLIVDYVTQAVH